MISNKKIISKDIAAFIPVVCHFDERTLLTKSGELVQIIKLDGFLRPNIAQKVIVSDLRTKVREAIKQHIDDSRCAVYLHVLREEHDITLANAYKEELPRALADYWDKLCGWQHQLVNTLYITIVHRGVKDYLSAIKFIKYVFFPIFTLAQKRRLVSCAILLTSIVNRVQKSLEMYGARVLKIRAIPPQATTSSIMHKALTPPVRYISEPASFYYQLLNLEKKNIEVGTADLSNTLIESDFTYLFNTIKLFSHRSGRTRFGAILTLKYPYELSTIIADAILQINNAFILTEVLLFASKSSAQAQWKYHKRIQKAAKVFSIYAASGLEALLSAAESGKINDYCSEQITILIYAENEEHFNTAVDHFVKTVIHDYGIGALREDLNMAGAFLAYLPGNFRFINRDQFNATKFAGTFSSIHSVDIGNYNGSKWGLPVTIFKNLTTELRYCFNFHDENEGNVFIIDPNNLPVTRILPKFLLMQAVKFSPRILVIGDELCHPLYDKLGFNAVSLNFADLMDKEENKSHVQIDLFNTGFVSDISGATDFICRGLLGVSSKDFKTDISGIIERLKVAESSEQGAACVAELVSNYVGNHSSMKSDATFLTSSQFRYFCTRNNLDCLLRNLRTRIDISAPKEGSARIVAFFIFVLLVKLCAVLDGKPTIIVVPSSDELFNLPLLPEEWSKLFDLLAHNNALAIFSVTKEQTLNTEAFNVAFKRSVNKFIVANKFATKAYKHALDLTDDELYKIKIQNQNNGIFLLKHGKDTLLTSINLSKNPELISILGEETASNKVI